MAEKDISKIVSAIVETYEDGSGINFIDSTNLPLRGSILRVLDLLAEIIFPGYTGTRPVTSSNINFVVGDLLCEIRNELQNQIAGALLHQCRVRDCDTEGCRAMAEAVTESLLNRLPQIRQILKTDIQAAFDGDPAAGSLEEIVLSYPGLKAITIYRIAHELYLADIPLLPRIMCERAHHETGIDIHPGATIGERFFIDHGTGVVIGETSIIGNNVKIYQGVTLGALAPAKGQKLKGIKRHPTIEDDVTIYAAATILGDVTIGKGALIGGNVWVKESVPLGVIVMMANPELVYIDKKNK